MAEMEVSSEGAGSSPGELDPVTGALVNFGEAWVREWQRLGGSLHFHPKRGSIHPCMPDYEYSKAYADDLAVQDRWKRKPSASALRRRKNELGWFYHGQMRALIDLLNAMPGGREAVKTVVLVSGILGEQGA